MVKNYYKSLGISPSANKHEIKAAYRKLAKKYHPDKNSSINAKNIFIEINEAYAYLTDDKHKILKNPVSNSFNKSKSRSRYSEEELNKRMEWAKKYAYYKKIKDEKVNEITYYNIQNSYFSWFIPLISWIAVCVAFLILMDFKLLPSNSINVKIVKKYIYMESGTLALECLDFNKKKIEFGVSLDKVKYINQIKNNQLTLQRSQIFNQNTHINFNNQGEILSIINNFCVYRVFYFYFLLLLLPLITIVSKGPNVVYILSTYIISSISVFGIIFLFLSFII